MGGFLHPFLLFLVGCKRVSLLLPLLRDFDVLHVKNPFGDHSPQDCGRLLNAHFQCFRNFRSGESFGRLCLQNFQNLLTKSGVLFRRLFGIFCFSVVRFTLHLFEHILCERAHFFGDVGVFSGSDTSEKFFLSHHNNLFPPHYAVGAFFIQKGLFFFPSLYPYYIISFEVCQYFFQSGQDLLSFSFSPSFFKYPKR